MRPSLWFVMPAHGRLELAAICLRQLRRTIDSLDDNGIRASAVVVACDENLDTARELGFGWVERDNQFVSRALQRRRPARVRPHLQSAPG